MTKNWKWIFYAILAISLSIPLVRIFGFGSKVVAGQGKDKTQPAPEYSVSTEDGHAVVTISSGIRTMAGMVVSVLKPVTSRRQITAPASILSAQALVTARSQYLATQANLQKIRAQRDVAEKEYKRLETLYENQQSASQKSLEAAQAIVRVDSVEIEAAQQNLQMESASVRQRWGSVAARWIANGSPELSQLLALRSLPVQLILPANSSAAPLLPSVPQEAIFSAPFGASAVGRLVSSFPQTNPVVQGLSFLYVIPARAGFAPGLNLVANWAAGSAKRGVMVPSTAIIWSAGRGWAYKEIDANRFERFAVPQNHPVANGWFVTHGFSAGDRIVTQGVEELFSVESQPPPGQSKAGGDEDDD